MCVKKRIIFFRYAIDIELNPYLNLVEKQYELNF